MYDSVFGQVKTCIRDRNAGEELLREHGVEHTKGGGKLSAEWNAGFRCPVCPDKSGSASFTRDLFLKCHQCGVKEDVFKWVARKDGRTAWEVCRELAQRFDIKLRGKMTGRAGRMPTAMTAKIVQQSIFDLWESDEARPVREFLRERKLCDEVALSDLGVGFVHGYLTFAQFDQRGKLCERYRGYLPGGQGSKWRWFGKGSGGPGLWPRKDPDGESRILLLEGEWDVLTALVRLRFDKIGWHPCTWTAGATSSPHPRDIPPSFGGREVHIAYDNDVFQGPNYGSYFVNRTDTSKSPDVVRAQMMARLSNLIDKVGPTFEGLNCKVFIRECPIPAKDEYGADFRDWADKGGRDFDEWKAHPLQDLPALGDDPYDVDFEDVFTMPFRKVRVKVQVDSLGEQAMVIPKISRIECPMNEHPCCVQCMVPRRYPDQMVDWRLHEREIAVALETRNPGKYLLQNVLQVPRHCPRSELVHMKVVAGSEWNGVSTDADEQHRKTLHIISEEHPSLSGEAEITGRIYPSVETGRTMMMMADRVKNLDAHTDITPHLGDLLSECPHDTNDVERIDEFLDRRWRDLSHNVTKVYGRRDIQVAHDILAHSPIEIRVRGALVRGWIDIAIFGDTRTGKTLTFERMLDFHKLGVHHTAVANITRAGLVMGGDQKGMMRPGLFPKCHRKMLMLDEWHFLSQQSTMTEHPMSWLQSARDSGTVSGIMNYGNRQLPAKVRFVTVSNWTDNSRNRYQYPCEHLKALYGPPETIARLDFALAVQGGPTHEDTDPVKPFWTEAMTRDLILRAWSLTPDQIAIDDEAIDYAWETSQRWADRYEYEELPLFTPEEKPYSILRIATSVANMTMSHVKDNPMATHVRKVHAEWAAQWLRETWHTNGYEDYSNRIKASHVVEFPFAVEKVLLCQLPIGMHQAHQAESVFAQLTSPFTSADAMAITGLDHAHVHAWLGGLVSHRVFTRKKIRGQNEFVCTRDGLKILSNLMRLCQHDPEEYEKRWKEVDTWCVGAPNAMMSGLKPLTSELWELLDEATPF